MTTDDSQPVVEPPERIWLSPTAFLYKTRPAPTYVYDETNKEAGDIEYSRAPVRDGGVAMVAADQIVREWIADCLDRLQSGEAISLPRGALTDLTKRITETPKQERSTAAINMLRRVYDAEFGFGAWPSPEEIEAVLKATTPPLAALTEDACSFCEHPASDHARGQLRRTEPCERPDCCCGNYQNAVKRQNAIE